ncbi:MAG: DUF4159 domain-containing protein [Bacteroidetes bacterium]|nr:DUF4159 domain-containing protein [Bacteroidota bacterium]
MRYGLIILVLVLSCGSIWAQTRTVNRSSSVFRIARLKYEGGSDWYNGQTEEPNLLRFVAQHTNIQTDPEYLWVDIASDDIFSYPFLFMTGHGNVEFTESEAKRLRAYLDAGGFLYIDDDYGLDKALRREMVKVYPDQEFKELPFSHELFHCHFDFPNGTPKIHEHDGKAPQAFGLFSGGRMTVLYTYESNPSDGWDDPDVHNDPPDKREEALKFGTNIVVYALTH